MPGAHTLRFLKSRPTSTPPSSWVAAGVGVDCAEEFLMMRQPSKKSHLGERLEQTLTGAVQFSELLSALLARLGKVGSIDVRWACLAL